MIKVFIGGSRKISKLSSEVHQRLDEILAKNLSIVIGDAPGIDKSVQQCLHAKGYRDVEVFCSGDRCRNNLGNWPTRLVAVNSSRRDFDFYATKDIQMAQEASLGLMIWDGESAGTLMNVWRLIKQNKKAVILEVPKRASYELKSESEWKDFFSACSDDVRQRIEKLSASESKVAAPVQASLL
jgi:hypothetical protein